jgi:hypothetical protein
VFYIIGMFSWFFRLDPMSAILPLQLTCIALVGALATGTSRVVFSLSRAAAVIVGAILISGPFFRYVVGNSFVSTIVAMPVLLYLVGTSVQVREGRDWLDAPLAFRYGACYVLLLLFYPPLFLVGIATQIALLVVLGLASGRATERPLRSTVADVAWQLRAVAAGLGVLALCALQSLLRLPGTLWNLSQKDIAGWPLDFLSPLAIIGAPGSLISIAVESATGRTLAIASICAAAAGLVWLFSWRYRSRTTPVEQTLVMVAAAAFSFYCGYFLILGSSYQQWKFASLAPLPLSFIVVAATMRLASLRFGSARPSQTRWTSRLPEGMLALAAVVCVGGNLYAHARVEPPLLRLRSTMRNLEQIDRLEFFRDMYVEMDSSAMTCVPVYFIRSKRMHLVGRSYFPEQSLSYERVSRDWPLLVQADSCETAMSGAVMEINGVGCLFLAPPSPRLDVSYPFSRPIPFVTAAVRRLSV